MALSFDLKLLKIQIAIKISEHPMIIDHVREYSVPRMCPIMRSCLGTRFKTLQNNPFAIQIAAIQKEKSVWVDL